MAYELKQLSNETQIDIDIVSITRTLTELKAITMKDHYIKCKIRNLE